MEEEGVFRLDENTDDSKPLFEAPPSPPPPAPPLPAPAFLLPIRGVRLFRESVTKEERDDCVEPRREEEEEEDEEAIPKSVVGKDSRKSAERESRLEMDFVVGLAAVWGWMPGIGGIGLKKPHV